MEAAIYCRVSTAEQAEGVSLESQRARCEEYIRLRGWKVARVYKDVESGSRSDREALTRLRENLHWYGAVVCWRLDRITRSMAFFCKLLEECQQNNVQFVSATEGFEIGSIGGEVMAKMLAVFAEMEGRVIGERTRASKRRMLEKGKIPWRAKYGYQRSDTGDFIAEKREACVVNDIYRYRVSGDTLEQIADRLNQRGIPRRGKLWGYRDISHILTDETYRGVLCLKKSQREPKANWRRIEGVIPPIVSHELWDRAQHRALHGRNPGKPGLFRGVITCARCNNRLFLRLRENGKRDYICSGRRHGKGCKMKQIGEMPMWNLFENHICNGFDPLVEPIGKDAAQIGLRNAEEAYGRIKTGYKEGFYEIDDLRETSKRMKRAKKAVQQSEPRRATDEEIEKARGELLQILNTARHGNIEMANRQLRRRISSIKVDANEERIEIVLR